jgi:hypothetical protein
MLPNSVHPSRPSATWLNEERMARRAFGVTLTEPLLKAHSCHPELGGWVVDYQSSIISRRLSVVDL